MKVQVLKVARVDRNVTGFMRSALIVGPNVRMSEGPGPKIRKSEDLLEEYCPYLLYKTIL